jgi:hypothetical protein
VDELDGKQKAGRRKEWMDVWVVESVEERMGR